MSDVVVLTREQLEELVDKAVERALEARREPPPEILDSESAGKLVGRSAKVMERLARSKQIPAYQLGRQWRFKRVEIVAWATNGGKVL
jgi:excisionase family DNA binding protein